MEDLERSVRFYRDGLGLRVANDHVEQQVAFLPMSGLVLGLWSRAKLAEDADVPAAAKGAVAASALAHNARDRAEVDRVLAEAERAGARITKAVHETFWGGYSGYFQDPDGHLWEVAHNPFWPLDENGLIHL